jgi:serine protease
MSVTVRAIVRITRPLIAALFLGVLSWQAAAAPANQQEPERYIVRYTHGSEQDVRAAIANARGKTHLELPNRRLMAVSLPGAAVKGLAQRNDVSLLELDPKRFPQAEEMPYGIPMVQAAGGSGLPENQASTRKVCIVDTGYDLGHEDLPTAGVTGNDGYGVYDTGNWYEDGHGHGTHVAGTIAGLGGNGIGVVGVNPNGQLPIHAVKVFNNQGNWAYGSDLIAAIDQCATAGAQIINMSLGGSGSSIAERDAFDAAQQSGLLSIAAAGNGGTSTLSYPASYDSVVSIGGIDVNEDKYLSSQFNHQVELTGPAVGVLSTLPGDTYAAWNGTSMATPHVSGVAALVWGYFETCSAGQIRTALAASAKNLGTPGRDSTFGYGLVQARSMHDLLLSQGCGIGLPPPAVPPALENGVPVNGLSGVSHDEHRFQLDVPAGATNLTFQIYGPSGDADLYVRYGAPPATDLWDCRPYINGNSETCSEAAPTPGTWYVMLHGYLDFSDLTLVASYVDDNSGPLPVFHYLDADVPSAGTMSGTYADLDANDGALQEIREVISGGKPSKRTSLAEHQWRFDNVTGGLAVTLHLVTAVEANAEGDAFRFDISSDGGATWDDVITIQPGGALKTYALPLPVTTHGTVHIRARDTDRSRGNQERDVLYMDQLTIETNPDPSETPPTAPVLVSADAQPSSVFLQWNDLSDNELGFEIRREIYAGGWGAPETVGTTTANATSWTDATVAPATLYRYRVAAYTASYSEASNTVEITTLGGISLTASGYKVKGKIFVELSWNGGTSLSLFRAHNGAEPVLMTAVDSTENPHTDATGLKGGHTLAYTLCPAGEEPGSTDCSNTATVSF